MNIDVSVYVKQIVIEAWSKTLYIRKLPLAARLYLTDETISEAEKTQRMIAQSICNEKGELTETYESIGLLPFDRGVSQIINEISAYNGFSDE